MTNIVVIGAGYAGVLATKKLEKKLRKKGVANETQITLIDKHPYHTMLTELHEVAACRVGEESVKMNLDQIFAGRKVNVVLDTVTKIQFEEQKVGKTADEVNATAVSEGVPSDADLAASVTIHIADFNTVITKAVNNAK